NLAGGVDADIAVASYRNSIAKSGQNWCSPEYVNSGISAVKIAHPLISDPVTNDFTLSDRAVLTGANASGKSTFMKSVAINCILAQTINTCVADRFEMQPLIVITCMALRDDILTGESYYYREAKCIKRMLDLIVNEDRVLVVIDEILKGTNTAERIAASKAIMDYIAATECLTLIATHDRELTENSAYKNYHFRNIIKDEDIVFDYLIHEGRNEQSNAIDLLTHLGYPDEVVEGARRYCK
ncbi:MAG: DNA mismatch repair protein MutS, partial [Lachnospiraceae bacterium]|nr:DNA mismatch repair protein MutS [Lachnospiraceae bacterium]